MVLAQWIGGHSAHIFGRRVANWLAVSKQVMSTPACLDLYLQAAVLCSVETTGSDRGNALR